MFYFYNYIHKLILAGALCGYLIDLVINKLIDFTDFISLKIS